MDEERLRRQFFNGVRLEEEEEEEEEEENEEKEDLEIRRCRNLQQEWERMELTTWNEEKIKTLGTERCADGEGLYISKWIFGDRRGIE